MDQQTSDLISKEIEGNEVCLFMKGTPDAPQCGFSMATSNILNEKKGPPPVINLFNEKNNGETVLKLITDGLINSAHDVSLGGIITAVSKMAIKGKKGFKLNKLKVLINKFEYYFGEDQGRYIIEIEPKNLLKVQKILKDNSVHYDEIGLVTEKDIIIDKEPIIHIDDLIKSNTNWLVNYMDK